MRKKLERIANKIIEWYEINGRKGFPWRRTENPYNILIAELMLQRTHAVEQVLPVYNDFLAKYPNVEKLSVASVEDIKTTINSLGLQNIRSRRFKELALIITKEFGGKIPTQHNDLKSLPGVGEYIANSVLCVAFDVRRPMVDANFGRVLGRIFYGEEDYPPSKDKTKRMADGLLPRTQFKEFNWGIIDFGALICRPKAPLCSACPLAKKCSYLLG